VIITVPKFNITAGSADEAADADHRLLRTKADAAAAAAP